MSWKSFVPYAALIALWAPCRPALCGDAVPPTPAAVKKAVSNAAANVRAAQEHRALAEADAGLLAQGAASPVADDGSVLRMEALTPTLKNLKAANLLGASGLLSADAAKLAAAASALADLPAPQAGDAKELAAALTEAQKQEEEVTQAQTDVAAAQTTLAGARDACVTSAGDLFTAWDARLAPLTDLTAEADSLLAVLPAGLADLAAAEAARGRLAAAWRLQTPLLAGLGADSAALAAAGVGQAKLDADVRAMAGKLPPWLGLLNGSVDKLNLKIAQQQPLVISEPADNVGAGKLLAQEGQKALDAQASLGGAVSAVALAEEGDTQLSGAAAKLRVSGAALRSSVDSLRATLSRLQEALGGDRTDWIAEPVSLFYFDDVRRLMNILNPAMHEVGDTTTLKARAASAQTQLNQAEADRSDAQALVNTRQHRLGAMRETLRQAKAQVKTNDGAALIFSRRLTAANLAEGDEKTKLTNATTASDGDSTNPLKTAALASATRTEGTTKQAALDASNRSADADLDKNKAQQSLDDLKNENDSLPAAITQAEEQLETAQQAVALQRRLALSAAQGVTQAFADTRDNAPFLKADADAGSRDPARRVEMYAFNDSKTIFLRGPRADVGSVKALISEFDQPVPQARLTLWTLELDSAGGEKAAEKFNRALQIVEGNLSGKRTQIAATLSLLRDAINQEVYKVGSTPDAEADRGLYQRYLGADDAYESRLRVYAGVFQDKTRKLLRLASIDLPDPAGTTTLGEALLVLSMMQRRYKNEVLDTFTASLEKQGVFDSLENYKQDNHIPKAAARRRVREADAPPGYPDGVWFASLRRALGAKQEGKTEIDDPCPAQIEILRAFKRAAWERIIKKLDAQSRELALTGKQLAVLDEERLQVLQQAVLKGGMMQAPDAAKTDNNAQQVQSLKNERDAVINEQFLPLLDGLPDKKMVRRFGDRFFAQEINPEASFSSAEIVKAAADAVREMYPSDTATPRVAAADQMLKEMIIAMEDDLDRQFVAPMLRNLTTQLHQEGIQVGVLNRTSVLASNRLIARVDPRGTGQVAVGEEQNALQDAQQLAGLVLATQTAGLSGLAGVSGALGGLGALPHDAPPSLYGVTNGSVFQVTPVIDPSGQALRFRFDYVSSTQVREPNGSLDPQLPRIEHHAVNTEVQLSNMEMRNISQFDGNVKLGIAPQKHGGIPILKDIPLLSDLPLIGWFSRSKGQAAVTQQSLIFAQTTIYPTINDLIPLLAGEFQSDFSGAPNSTLVPRTPAPPTPQMPQTH